MIDIISTIAGILGFSAKDLYEELNDIKSGLSEKKLLDRTIKEGLYINNTSLSDFTNRYYSKNESSYGLKQYQFRIDGNHIKTSIFCESNYLRIGERIDAFKMQLKNDIPLDFTDLNLISKDYIRFINIVQASRGLESGGGGPKRHFWN